jgi:hypothetical protein
MAHLTRCFPIAAILLGSIFVSCQTTNFGPPETLSGEEVHNAYQSWAADLTLELDYPVQMHVDYGVELAADLADIGESMQMEIEMDLNFLCDGPQAVRSWGAFDIDATMEGEKREFTFDYELANDSNGLRLLLDDHGIILQEAGIEIPKAYKLSQDRLEILVALYGDLIEESMVLYGPSVEEIWASIGGAGELFHPKNFTRFLTGSDFITVEEWHKENGQIRLLAKLDGEVMGKAMALGMQEAGLPFDLSIFDNLVFEVVLDQTTGDLLDYVFNMDVPMEVPVPELPSGKLKMDIGVEIRVQMVPVAADAPTVALPVEGLLVLDSYFDQFLPMIEMAIDMQKAQMQQMMGEEDAGEDFSF